MRRLADRIGRCIDLFHVGPVAAIVPRETFRYAACGAMTLGLDACWYALFYHLVFRASNFDLGFVVVSPHVAALVLVFPITFFTGFWLNREVAFRRFAVPSGTQLIRYALSVGGSILLTYGCIKFFVEVCGLWPTPSKVATSILTAVYSYLAARYFTFREAE